MSLQSCRNEVVAVINNYVKQFGARNEVKETKEILAYIESKGIVLDPMFLISDMCYNKTNRANLKTFSTDIQLFEHVARGKYYILGEKYPYSGEVIWTDKHGFKKTVGEWVKGNLKYWGEKL